MAGDSIAARIREACGVERFDVADTQNTLNKAVEVLMKRGFDEEDALAFVGALYRTSQKELTTKTT